jgi:energy-coupling factor transporter ATP-binding protein EcfA2
VVTEAISVERLSKLYATRDGGVAALERISFSIDEGEFVAVVGPSGCGKSTLLKILALYRVPGQHLRHRGACGQPGAEDDRSQGQEHRSHLDGLGRRADRASPRRDRRHGPRQRHQRRGRGGGRPDRRDGPEPTGRGAESVRYPVRDGGERVKLRLLDTKDIDRFPSNGLLALEETLKARPKEAAAVARGYAKGTIFAINNPEAAIRMLYEVYPQTRPTGKDEATAIRDDVRVLQARIVNWKLDKAGVSKWGENSEANYAAYAEFLLKWGVIKQKVDVHDLITNELIGSINNFDPAKVAAEARAYKR